VETRGSLAAFASHQLTQPALPVFEKEQLQISRGLTIVELSVVPGRLRFVVSRLNREYDGVPSFLAAGELLLVATSHHLKHSDRTRQ